MPYRGRRSLTCLILGVIVILMVSACAPADSPGASQPPQGTYPVESIFREFYNLLGGEKTLGYAISPLIEADNVKMQYTEAALLRFDPVAADAQKYSLSPLGADLHLVDPPLALPEQDGERIVDGYLIFEDFVPLYDTLQGARFAGKPLTQVRVDRQRGRIEQYFSQVGFYELLDDPSHAVHLLAYGAWKCDAYCSFAEPEAARVPPQSTYPEPFIGGLIRLGLDFTGQPLSGPYLAADGMLEQVYQNLVVYAPPDNLGHFGLRPIPEKVGYPPTAPVAKVNDDRLVFYPTADGLGHEVPKVFEDYITAHGGLEISGMPATEIFAQNGAYRQCFTNICLDYDPGAAAAQRIRPAAIGEDYLRKFPAAGQAQAATPEAAPGNVTLTAWPEHTLIRSDAGQVIHVRVTKAGSQAPVAGAALDMVIYTPDGGQIAHPLPPTDAQGQSSADVIPITAPNGSMILYQVCVLPAAGSKQCVRDSYVIWGNR